MKDKINTDLLFKYLGELHYKVRMYEEVAQNQSKQIEKLTKQLQQSKESPNESIPNRAG